ncbi:MAG: type II secretion system F family protein [Rickettsiales bacterium]
MKTYLRNLCLRVWSLAGVLCVAPAYAQYPGQPLSLKQMLPRGVEVNEFYVGFAGAALLVTAYAIYSMFRQRDVMKSRIQAIQERRKELRGEFVSNKRRRKKPEASVNFMRRVVEKFQLVKKLQADKAETILIEGGLRSKDAIFIFTFFIVALPIVFGIIGTIIWKIDFGYSDKVALMDLLWPIVGIYMGLKLPWIYVSRVRKKRYLQIQRSLSDVLDLMTICAEAGLSLSATLDRVAKELELSYPEMAEELSLTSVETGFLPDRKQALTNLAQRCQLPEVRGVVSVLIQTEKYGTPIAQALRVLSAEFRQARMLRAEQKAARLPALMTVPMITCILPTLFIVIIAPAAVKLMGTD